MAPRKFAQIAMGRGDGYAVALADDGTAWMYVPRDHAWRKLPALPSKEEYP